MAKTPKKKSGAGGNNPDGRKNGKAWKKDKDKPAPAKTYDRQMRDEEIRRAREVRRQAGIARAAAEREAREQEILEKKAALLAEVEAEEIERRKAKSLRKALRQLPPKIETLDVLGKNPEEENDKAAMAVYFQEAQAFVKAVMPVL